jgi:hypothetical protein
MISRPIKSFIMIFNLIFCSYFFADDYEKIDTYVSNTPKSAETSIDSLVSYLIQPANDDFEKARAIYVWMAKNISYDYEAFFSGNYDDTSAANVLLKRKSICDGYSNLFMEMANKAGIMCIKITGYAKGYGYKPGDIFSGNPNHAWNAVKLDNQWYLIDVTWSAGYISDKVFVFNFNDRYFLTSPDIFILDHFPLDPKWQLLEDPIDIIDFERSGLPKYITEEKDTASDMNSSKQKTKNDTSDRIFKDMFPMTSMAIEVDIGSTFGAGYNITAYYYGNKFLAYYPSNEFPSNIIISTSLAIPGGFVFFPIKILGVGVSYSPGVDLQFSFLPGKPLPYYLIFSNKIKLVSKLGSMEKKLWFLFEAGINISEFFYIYPYSNGSNFLALGPSFFIGYDTISVTGFHYSFGINLDVVNENKNNSISGINIINLADIYSFTIGLELRFGFSYFHKIKNKKKEY